jgi:hypothetical protein
MGAVKNISFIALISLLCTRLEAQTYKDSITKYREHYKQDFLTDARSPLKAADTGYLRFYKADPSYRVIASMEITKDAKPFMIPTHSGKLKPYRGYGILSFKLHGKSYVLHAYQSADSTKKELAAYLFIPFTDKTNTKETYGAGRYIDIDTSEIKGDKVVLDFNKCYNPYCAFADGYSCPFPPRENDLKTEIKAGEKLFGKEHLK